MVTASGTGTPAAAPAPAVTVTQSAFGTMFAQAAAPLLFETLARDIAYTPAGASGRTISAIVSLEPERTEHEDMGSITTQDGRVTIWLNDDDGVAAPARGDGITDGGLEWYVTEVENDADKGVGTLTIRRVQVGERSREEYRK